MTAHDLSIKLPIEPPGPGPWKQDGVHFPRPMTRYFQEMHPDPFRAGTQAFARYYGMLIDGLQMAYVQGFGYNQVVPAPESELPERFRRAEQVYAQKLWREQLREWDNQCKPAAIAMHRELQLVDADALSDAELVAYLRRCRDHHAAMITQHMRFTGGAVLPVGDFLAHAGDWTELPTSELLGLMRGSAEVSSGGSDEMVRLKGAFAADAAARTLLASDGDPVQLLERLRTLGGEAGAAVRGYLDLVGHRLIDGFDIAEPTALELPEPLLRSLRIALSGEAAVASDLDVRVAEVRARVPAAHQAQFDELLGEARLMYRLRDERGVYSDIWASGLMRRAALAAGRRVSARGRIATPLHMLDAGIDEMCALVAASGGPMAEELAQRAAYRAAHTAKDVPPLLGPPPPPPPDLAALPPHVARLMRATFIALGHVFGSAQATNEDKMLYGLAASKGVYEGPARRVSGPSEFGRIQQGDVLVTESTTEAFNILLPLLGGIVTDNGGLLSHAAIVAREYGIPGVVGTREATERISDGMRLRVDGDAGEVTVLG
ncbi:pyruvate, water dikinase [Variovorax sp. HW608]|uniref:PEP-utilizing enzyme n=1 Tax=Variovorax sp. HW608 TaxID=1034889 RepID=UPI00081FEC49|nr:PEP-utilizing enzyme [Variovorax sp. HW608]SCK18325.1 pyruvate, water dikinase [Variovorax sp. HW608]